MLGMAEVTKVIVVDPCEQHLADRLTVAFLPAPKLLADRAEMANGAEQMLYALDGTRSQRNQMDRLGLQNPLRPNPFFRWALLQDAVESAQEVLGLVAEWDYAGSCFGQGNSQTHRIHGMVAHPVPLNQRNRFACQGP